MKVTGAQIVVHLLEELGVTTVAGIPGGAILPLYEALADSSVRHVLARHEQGAGFIAQGMARATGKPGVCLATSGPGATNLVTALADAKADSVPLVALTANVPRALLGTDAFQEVDLEAWPAVLGLPAGDFQSREPGQPWVDEVCAAVAAAARPVIFAGGGARDAWEALRAWARAEGIPVASTLMGLGLMEPGDPLYLGMVGMHGTPAANRALAEADLVLALGVRFDDRATGKVSEFCPRARVVHVDVDPAELGKNHPADFTWAGETSRFLEAVTARSPLRFRPDGGFDPGSVLRALADAAGPEVLVTTDVGQHQMWAAQYFPVRKPGTFLTSGGLGTMGFGLPAAIGAALGCPGRRVVCITGDGAVLMNIQELATLAELNLPVTLVLFNNGGLGLVRQQQELFYGARYLANGLEGGPDFPAVARAFGLAAWRVGVGMPVGRAFAEALAHPGPSLVEVPLASRSLVFPMVAPGAPNTEILLARPE